MGVDIAKPMCRYSKCCIELAGHVLVSNQCSQLDDRLIVEVLPQIRDNLCIDLTLAVSHCSCVAQGCLFLLAEERGLLDGEQGIKFFRRGAAFQTAKGVKVDAKITAINAVSYTHLRAHETRHDLVCRLLLEKKK